MKLEDLLEELSEGAELNYEDFPAALVVFTDSGPTIWLNKWEKLNARLLDNFTVHAIAARERLRRETIKAEKEANNE